MAGNKVNNTWTHDTPPKFAYLEKVGLTPVKTEQGWCHPITGEILVAIRNLENRADVDDTDTTGVTKIVSVEWFNTDDYTSGDTMLLQVTFNEDVYAGDATCTFTSASLIKDQIFIYSPSLSYTSNISMGETAADSTTGFVAGNDSAVNNIILTSTVDATNSTAGEIAFGDGTFGNLTGTVIRYDSGDGTEDAQLSIPAELNYNYSGNSLLYTFAV